MNILVIGSGGREHALSFKLYQSGNNNVYCNPGNPGTEQFAKNVSFDINDEHDLISFCENENVDLVVVGPEQPLADGIVDILNKHKINCFGPNKYASQLESSKSFAKQFMDEFNIPTAGYKVFSKDQKELAYKYIDSFNSHIVLKADGLAGGKGVFICNSKDEAKLTLDEFFEGKFSSASETVVIEEFLNGVEASVFAICDGDDYVLLPPSQDYKRAKEGDQGLNTGGMGSFAPTPYVNKDVLDKIAKEIVEPTLRGMKVRGSEFKGCLFCGLMIYNNQPKVIEFNVRFGDPETQSVLSLIDGNMAELFLSASKGNINKSSISIKKNKAACTVILASKGYPESYHKGFEIKGLKNNTELKDRFIFHAGTKKSNGQIINNGGRVLGITAIAKSIEEAKNNAYDLVMGIDFENKYFRKDIAADIKE
jgi:phosphoribosylamine--glycine ligase